MSVPVDDDATPPDLDASLPAPMVRTHHRREARVPAEALWAAARELRLDQAGALGRLVRWRIPDLPPGETFRGLFASPPFTVLAEGPLWTVSGLVGRIWTLRRDYPRLEDAAAFRGWDAPGTVRVLIAHWVEPGRDGRGALVSEARVSPVDRAAALRLRALWTLISPWERLIGGEGLARVVRRAESG